MSTFYTDPCDHIAPPPTVETRKGITDLSTRQTGRGQRYRVGRSVTFATDWGGGHSVLSSGEYRVLVEGEGELYKIGQWCFPLNLL